MTATMWIVTLWAMMLPILALALRVLELRRDTFFLLVYVQALAYVDIAPLLASSDLSTAIQDRYAWVQTWALVLFQIPVMLAYVVMLRRRRRKLPTQREYRVSATRLALFVGGSCALGIAYFVIGAKYDLLYRRIGEELASVQLSMNLVEFALYRAFIELGPFLIVVQLFLLRTHTNMSSRLRAWAWVGVALTTLLFMGYALVNTRLNALLTLAIIYAVVNVTSDGHRRIGLGAALGTVVLAAAGLYALRVVANVRLSFSNGDGIFALQNFLPVATREGQLDDTLRWRLNGVDLIAIIADNVEAQGPALGTAWVVPFVLSLDPIVRTPFSVEAKRANLTSAKTWLLLRYGGVSKADYYSCMLSDAYGNFSIYGFLFAGLVVGSIVAVATASLRWSAAPVGVVFAAFALTRVLPFEQEFESILFGWYKLIPFVIAALLVCPLRRPARRPEPIASAGSAPILSFE
jgi:hypothetical protein